MIFRDALQLYFATNGFDESSYTSPTFELKLGNRILTLANPKPRQDGIKIHDLNHLFTGYSTDRDGESQQGAWEIGCGIGKLYPMAWLFNTNSMFTGLVFCTKKTLAAYARGKACKCSFYKALPPNSEAYHFYEAFLDLDVDYARYCFNDAPEAKFDVRDLPKILTLALIGGLLYIPIGLAIFVALLKSKKAS